MKNLGMYIGKDLPYFKEFTLDLGYKGVTIIRGRNMNAKGMSDRNNGSGKSLLLSGLAEILINSNPSIERNEAFARKALFPFKTSQLTLEVNNNIICKGRFGGAAVSYGIETDGGGIEKVKKEVANEHLAEHLGYNEDSFYTLVYLDGGKDFPLIVGTPTQRIQFLSNIFSDLEVYEMFYGHFSDLLSNVNYKVGQLETLEEQLEEMKVELSDKGTEIPTDEEIKTVKSKIQRQKDRRDKLRNELRAGEVSSTFLELMLDLEAGAEKLNISASDVIKDYEAESEKRKDLEIYKKSKRKLIDLKKQRDELEDEILEFEDKDIDDSKYDMIQGADSNADKLRAWADEIKSTINTVCSELKLPFRVKAPKRYALIPNLQTLVEFLLQCLMPGEDIIAKETPKSPTAIAKGMRDSDVLKLVSNLQEAQRRLGVMLSSKVNVEDLGESLSEEEIRRIKKARKNRIHLEDLHHQQMRINAEHDRVREEFLAKKPAEVLSERDFKLLCSLRDKSITLKGLGIKIDDVKDISSSELKKLRDELDEVTKYIEELTEKRSTMEAVKTFYEENQTAIQSLETKIEKYTKYRDNQPLIDALKKAFSNKGIRVNLLNDLTNVLSKRMNENAHLVFPEPVEFRFELSERNCDIYVVRNPGTKFAVESDIRLLSRGERKSFSLLLLYSMLPLIPKHKRLNIVVMDEMTSNMDQPTRTKVFRDYIPALRDIIPHVIMADTGTLEVDDAREYYVVKQGNTSRLEENIDALFKTTA